MNAPQYHGIRRLSQIAALIALALIPVLGVFRIDLTTASLMLFDHPVTLRNFPVILGLALFFAAAPLVTYTTIGAVWCGWLCPQNSVAEWANVLTHRFLGHRANVDVESEGLIVAPSKNKVLNWTVLSASLLGISLVLGVIPLFYFVPPDEIWSLLTLHADPQFAQFMHRLYFVSVVAVLVDAAVFRHFWCNFLCPYRYGQLLFRTKDALHVHYDAARSADCTRCNYCTTMCVTGITPTNIGPVDRCIDCGECIDACNRLHERKNRGEGLLRFEFGAEQGASGVRAFFRSALRRLGVPGLLTLVALAMIAWGLLQPN